MNLLTNACDASKPGDRVEIYAFESNGIVQLEVMDQGEGIPKESQEAVFEPFFTTKEPGKGTGLGLSMVYRIIQDHNGAIEIDSAPDLGTRIIVRLPQSPNLHHQLTNDE